MLCTSAEVLFAVLKGRVRAVLPISGTSAHPKHPQISPSSSLSSFLLDESISDTNLLYQMCGCSISAYFNHRKCNTERKITALHRQGLARAGRLHVTWSQQSVIMACQGAVLIFLPGRVVSLLATVRLMNPWKWHKYGGLFSILSILF